MGLRYCENCIAYGISTKKPVMCTKGRPRADHILVQGNSLSYNKAGQVDMEQAKVRCTDLFHLMSDQMSSELYMAPTMMLSLVRCFGRTYGGALFVLLSHLGEQTVLSFGHPLPREISAIN